MMLDKAELTNIGLQTGDTVMLHASVRAIGKSATPNEVIQAILYVIGSSGTLIMYIDCEAEFTKIGRGKLTTQQEEDLILRCPAFDCAATPARKDYGIVAEFFRQWPGCYL